MKKLGILILLLQALVANAGHLSNSDFEDLINQGCPISTVYRVYNSISQKDRDRRSAAELKAIVKDLCDNPETMVEGIKANLQTPEICGGSCEAGPLKVDGHLATHIRGQQGLDKHLSNATYLGEGEFGKVYNLGDSGVVIKIQKDEGSSLAPEIQYTDCLAKHLPSLGIDVLATVPITRVKLELEGGQAVNALLKARVFGETLLQMPRESKDFPDAKHAVELLIEGWIHYLEHQETPDFQLSDFKMSNLMWGQTYGQAEKRLILIDINCFDEPSFLRRNYADVPATNKTEYFAKDVLGHNFLNGTINDRKWSTNFGSFEFKDPVIQKTYTDFLVKEKQMREKISKSKARERDEEEVRIAKLNFCKKDFIEAKRVEIRAIQEKVKAGLLANALSSAEIEKMKHQIKFKKAEIVVGSPIECPPQLQ